MNPKAEKIRSLISSGIPEGSVIPRHTEKEHFYFVPSIDVTLPSVTGGLQVIKEEGLAEWKKNRALDYVFEHYKEFNDSNVMDHLAKASERDADIFGDAGDIGTIIHDARQKYFADWILHGKRPESTLPFIKEDMGIKDNRAVSAMGALEKFCIDTGYLPVASELMLWSWRLGVAGTMDDLGLMPRIVRQGDKDCEHDILTNWAGNQHCSKCSRKIEMDLVLMDLKSSNNLKPSYWFQVACYALMLWERLKLKPKRYIILKLDKFNRTYKVEEIKHLTKVKGAVKRLFEFSKVLELVKETRKDNGKIVAAEIKI